MAAANLAGLSKKQLKKEMRSLQVKSSFASPFSPQWSPLPQEDMHFILKTLQDKLLSTGLEKKEVKVFRPWRKKKNQKPSTAPVQPVPEEENQSANALDPPKNGWTDVSVRKQLAIGVNEVTKALERNELSLLLVCKSAKPQHMTSHLLGLSASRGVPACQVPRLSLSVAPSLGLKSVLALGFRRSEAFTDTVDAIMPRVPAVNVAWLQSAEATDIHSEGEKRGKKRKLESESGETSCTLQPLNIKKTIANPARKKKKVKGKTPQAK